jgi:CRISPR/Cas system-associated exonuclease Cas4 (RecB family)
VIESFLKWWETMGIEPVTPEIKLCSPTLQLAGTADLLCRVDGKLTIMDWKTGKGIYPEMFLQLAAYALMYEEEFGEKIEQLYIVNASIDNMFQTQVSDQLDLLKKTYLNALALYKTNMQVENLFKKGEI